MSENITNETLTPQGDGGEAVLNPSDASNLTLEELNSKLGKEFQTKESALKAISDTFSYVGKKKEDIAKELKDNGGDFVSRDEFLQEQFYSKNPEYAPYKNIIQKIDKDPTKAIQDETFKSIFEKASNFEKIETSKSVLHSNPRLMKVSDDFQEAREASQKGDQSTAEKKVVSGLIDALDLRK